MTVTVDCGYDCETDIVFRVRYKTLREEENGQQSIDGSLIDSVFLTYMNAYPHEMQIAYETHYI